MTERKSAQRVAIIGAGISGVVTAAHLKTAGLEVTVFERSNAAGGVWLYDERRPVEPRYPAVNASKGEDLSESGTKDALDRELRHAPPSPCYDGLKNNVATRLMRTKLNAWPPGTPDFVSHRVLKDYIQDTAKKTGVEELTIYGAAVTDMQKADGQWRLTYTTLRKDSLNGDCREHKKVLIFDYVVVASGHYHAPRVPDLPGLREWRNKWPKRVWHSKAYRRPSDVQGQSVLLIGAGTSSVDIARELGAVGKKIYQSSRNGYFDLPASMLPPDAVRLGEIESFERVDGVEDTLPDDKPIPLKINLKSGEQLCNIDTIIIATGYHITLPFLAPFHEDSTPVERASETVLVTDGTQLHNLHKDIFYIPDPSLMFVGVPYFSATFTLFEFQALAVTAVLSDIADLPSKDAMRQEYRDRVKRKGFGKPFHSVRGEEVEYVNELLAWINETVEVRGGKRVEGHSEIWHEAKEEQTERIKKWFEGDGVVAAESLITLAPCS